MRDVVVVVSVSPGGVSMLRLFALALGVLVPIGGSRLHVGYPPPDKLWQIACHRRLLRASYDDPSHYVHL